MDRTRDGLLEMAFVGVLIAMAKDEMIKRKMQKKIAYQECYTVERSRRGIPLLFDYMSNAFRWTNQKDKIETRKLGANGSDVHSEIP